MQYRYFISLAYNGSAYHGWQKQLNAPSVQQTLENSLAALLSENVPVIGCGRTDTGVHARQYFAHFESGVEYSQEQLDQLTFRLNRFLPKDIVIFWIRKVDGDLHARFSAVKRTYRYYIHTRKDPFLNEISWFVYDKPAIESMNKGALMLLGRKDFTSFSKLHSGAKSNICELMVAEWKEEGHQLTFTITADRFLRNMVRAVVGTLVDLGQGKINQEDLLAIIEAKNRSDAGQSVPAHGLFLEEIEYPVDF